jgi:hypothetical protein
MGISRGGEHDPFVVGDRHYHRADQPGGEPQDNLEIAVIAVIGFERKNSAAKSLSSVKPLSSS